MQQKDADTLIREKNVSLWSLLPFD